MPSFSPPEICLVRGVFSITATSWLNSALPAAGKKRIHKSPKTTKTPQAPNSNFKRNIGPSVLFMPVCPKADQFHSHMGASNSRGPTAVILRRHFNHIPAAPRMFIPAKSRRIIAACPEESPPQTGVPVPGTKAGSRQSISKLR